MFESIEIVESIYEGVVKPSYKKLPGKKTTVLDSVEKIGEETPCQILTQRRMRALASTINDM